LVVRQRFDNQNLRSTGVFHDVATSVDTATPTHALIIIHADKYTDQIGGNCFELLQFASQYRRNHPMNRTTTLIIAAVLLVVAVYAAVQYSGRMTPQQSETPTPPVISPTTPPATAPNSAPTSPEAPKTP
jgi:hypothetical protein